MKNNYKVEILAKTNNKIVYENSKIHLVDTENLEIVSSYYASTLLCKILIDNENKTDEYYIEAVTGALGNELNMITIKFINNTIDLINELNIDENDLVNKILIELKEQNLIERV